MFDRVNGLSRRHLLQSAGGIALSLGVLGGAPARADETITYLFPAPPRPVAKLTVSPAC